MTTRDSLDLRGLSLTELTEMYVKRADDLSTLDFKANCSDMTDELACRWLADRRQLREEMERRRDIEALGVPAEKLGPGNTYANLYDRVDSVPHR